MSLSRLSTKFRSEEFKIGIILGLHIQDKFSSQNMVISKKNREFS